MNAAARIAEKAVLNGFPPTKPEVKITRSCSSDKQTEPSRSL